MELTEDAFYCIFIPKKKKKEIFTVKAHFLYQDCIVFFLHTQFCSQEKVPLGVDIIGYRSYVRDQKKKEA